MIATDPTTAKLQAAILENMPLWRDILNCRRLDMSEPVTANCCGVKLKTLRRHLGELKRLGFIKEEARS